jgi:glycosyltransferase involved in cell wall biosynthesis
LKILHISTFFEPELGYEEYCNAKEQAKQGHDVHVVCTNLRSDRTLKGKNKYLPIGLEKISNIIIYRLPCLPEIKSDFVIPFNFKKTLNKIKPDIIHAHTSTQFTSWLAVKFANKTNIPIVVDLHGIGWQEKKKLNPIAITKLIIKKIFYLVEKSTIINANMLVPTTELWNKKLHNDYNFEENKVFLNSLGVDLDIFNKNESIRKSKRNELLIKQDECVIIFFGFIRKPKRLDLVLDTLTRLPENYKLIIAGPIEKNVLNDTLILKLLNNLKNRIIVTGKVSQTELNQLLNAADIALWPANVSIGILQSSAIGLPSIYPDWAYNFSPISRETTIAELKIKLIINKINQLFSSPDYYDSESIKAIKFANTRSYAIKSNELIKLYKKIIYENKTYI